MSINNLAAIVRLRIKKKSLNISDFYNYMLVRFDLYQLIRSYQT